MNAPRPGLCVFGCSRHSISVEVSTSHCILGYFILSGLFLYGLTNPVQSVYAQFPSAESGLPLLTNYAPADYDAQAYNSDVLQDEHGVMYFGNAGGILVFDGTSWRRIEMPNQSIVQSLDIDAMGRIWVGAQGDLGYLEADTLGQLKFVSLLDSIPPEHRQFEDVWNICSTTEGTYFRVFNTIFHYKRGEIEVLPADVRFHRMFCVDDRLYVRQWDAGLMVKEGDSLVLVPGGGSICLGTDLCNVTF